MLAAPVAQKERILLLDSLRGIAILGILLMNIGSFSMAPWQEFDPTLKNESGINYYLWYGVIWLMNGTQRALFSMLFGAGVILFLSRKESRLEGLAPADYFFRRQLWLIVLSLFDVYVLLWNGDILFDYACYGMLIFTFRKLSVKGLWIAAAVCFLFLIARENRDLYENKLMISEGEEIASIDTIQTKLTALQRSKLEDMERLKTRSTKKSKLTETEETNEVLRGTYRDVYKWRTENYIDSLVDYLYLGAWDVLVFMLLGMAFFKSGLLTGDSPVSHYIWLVIAGLAGLVISYFHVRSLFAFDFNAFNFTRETHFIYFQIGRVLRSVGFLGLILLLYKSGMFERLFAMFRPAGQMALTNYLGQSLICGVIFNGYGFGMFGKMQRYEIYLVVLAVWVFQIVTSHIWLKYFLFGPCEWAWRSLTYWKKQPFLKAAG